MRAALKIFVCMLLGHLTFPIMYVNGKRTCSRCGEAL